MILPPPGFTRLVRGRLRVALSLSPPRSRDVPSPLAMNAAASSGFFAVRFFFLGRGNVGVAPALATGLRGTTEARSGEALVKEKILALGQVDGILGALALVGVLPNTLVPVAWDQLVTQPEIWDAGRRVKGSSRSDIALPFAAWRGKLGVDWRRAKALFAVTAEP